MAAEPQADSRAGALGAGLASSVVVLLIWEGLGRAFGVRPILLPLPSQVLVELVTEWSWYLGHAGYTLMTTLLGFALSVLAGVLLGAMIVGSRFCERYVYPLIVAMNSVPKVAIAPLFVIWLGTGPEPKVAIAFLIAVFAVIVDTIHGLRSVPQDVLDVSRVFRGRPLDVFFKVKLPSALPSIVTGMKVAISLALVGAIVGEFVSSQRGLGYVIMSAQGMFDTPRVFAALVVLAVIGMLLYAAVEWLERVAMPWRSPHGH